MAPALILWVHAVAAIAFAVLALDGRRTCGRALAAAAALTALWALAVAGLGPRDPAARLVEGMRDLAWLAAVAGAARWGRGEPLGWGLGALHGVAALLALGLCALAVAGPEGDPSGLGALRLVTQMMLSAAALVLVHDLAVNTPMPRRRAVRPVCAAAAVLWAGDLLIFAAGWWGGWSPVLVLARGAAALGVAAALAVGAHGGGRGFRVSRDLRLAALAVGALALYAAAVAALSGVVEAVAGAHARVAQTGLAVGAGVTLATLACTPWLRAWTRVKVERHLFGQRYDYRAAWSRFTGTLGRPGGEAALAVRIVQATADLVDSPAGLLLAADADGLTPVAAWNWEGGGEPSPALAAHLAATRRVVELDQVRRGLAPAADDAAAPRWMLERPDAWAVVPLVHGDALNGAILLARPPVARALDWEDFDLLRLAGRQAASYLAEDRAAAALAEAQRFDEFHRRFAFILHDIKNLASQVALTARNAERHADNPAFRADMVATLKDSADRMTALIARLSQREPSPEPVAGPPRAVALAPLLADLAARWRPRHPVEVLPGDAWALADAPALARLLDQLLQNAAEASRGGEPVTLAARAEDGRAVAEVADRGHGMSARFVRDELFRPFRSSKPGGFGLGAFEARALARAMGGDLAVDSREGEGARFCVLLPLARGMEEAA